MTIDLDSLELGTRECVERTLDAYIVAALWSSTDDHGDPLDDNHGPDDLAESARAAMLETVAGFLSGCWEDDVDLSALEPEQIGHDLWLTQNHHGAGFWDRGLGDLGEELTRRAHTFGEVTLYVVDGTLYYL